MENGGGESTSHLLPGISTGKQIERRKSESGFMSQNLFPRCTAALSDLRPASALSSNAVEDANRTLHSPDVILADVCSQSE